MNSRGWPDGYTVKLNAAIANLEVDLKEECSINYCIFLKYGGGTEGVTRARSDVIFIWEMMSQLQGDA